MLDESCSLVYIANAVKVFKECNILHFIQEDSNSIFHVKLNHDYNSENTILELIGKIRRYKI